eukprot:360141-Chlamydomonas_euryale.AAC.2
MYACVPVHRHAPPVGHALIDALHAHEDKRSRALLVSGCGPQPAGFWGVLQAAAHTQPPVLMPSAPPPSPAGILCLALQPALVTHT